MSLTTLPHGIEPQDYERIEAAVMETARGRWFLLEYARRQRADETGRVLAALDRLENGIAQMRGVSPAPDETGLRLRLLELVAAFRQRGVDERLCREMEALVEEALDVVHQATEATTGAPDVVVVPAAMPTAPETPPRVIEAAWPPPPPPRDFAPAVALLAAPVAESLGEDDAEDWLDPRAEEEAVALVDRFAHQIRGLAKEEVEPFSGFKSEPAAAEAAEPVAADEAEGVADAPTAPIEAREAEPFVSHEAEPIAAYAERSEQQEAESWAADAQAEEFLADAGSAVAALAEPQDRSESFVEPNAEAPAAEPQAQTAHFDMVEDIRAHELLAAAPVEPQARVYADPRLAALSRLDDLPFAEKIALFA